MAVNTTDAGDGAERSRLVKRGLAYLRELRDQVVDTGHAAPDIAQSPGLAALRRTEKALSLPMLVLIVGVYTVLGGLVVLVFGGFLFALISA
jgi:hypothetical protein